MRTGSRARAAGIIAFAFVLALPARQAAAQNTNVDLELVLAVDVSFSMDETEQRVQRAGYVEAFRNQSVIQAILSGSLGRVAVTYVEWGGSVIQAMPWTVIDSPQSAFRFAEGLAEQPIRRLPFTSISDTIAFSRQLLRANAFQGRRSVIDISGDGPNNYGAPAPVARDAALKEGITIDGLPIMLDEPSTAPTIADIDDYYQHCVIGGNGAFLIRVRSLAGFAEAIRSKLVTEITGPKLSEVGPSLQPVAYLPERAYNCFIGEELLEHPKAK
jgi:hypothetical protein